MNASMTALEDQRQTANTLYFQALQTSAAAALRTLVAHARRLGAEAMYLTPSDQGDFFDVHSLIGEGGIAIDFEDTGDSDVLWQVASDIPVRNDLTITPLITVDDDHEHLYEVDMDAVEAMEAPRLSVWVLTTESDMVADVSVHATEDAAKAHLAATYGDAETGVVAEDFQYAIAEQPIL